MGIRAPLDLRDGVSNDPLGLHHFEPVIPALPGQIVGQQQVGEKPTVFEWAIGTNIRIVTAWFGRVDLAAQQSKVVHLYDPVRNKFDRITNLRRQIGLRWVHQSSVQPR